ncbi:hypothetical protein ACVIGB_001043 [Bradyrhizobium sp. USDA 4341]
MSRSANAIAFGRHNAPEIVAALRATGLVEDGIETFGGKTDLVIGTLSFTRKGKDSFSTLWIFDGSIGDSLDIYSGDRTLLSTNFGDDDILRGILKSFGGYVRPDDGEEEKWDTVDAENVEFSPEDRVRIQIAKIVGPKRVESIMEIASDPAKCQALVGALTAFSAITNKFDLRENLEGPGMM